MVIENFLEGWESRWIATAKTSLKLVFNARRHYYDNQ
jgi:hypothetical protein